MLPLPQTLTLREARDTLRMLTQTLQRDGSPALTVDASPLRDFDSSALAVLLECRRVAAASGQAFAVRGASPKFQDLAALYGVEELLGLAPA